MPDTRHLLDEADGIHGRPASLSPQERRIQQGLGRRLSPSFSSFSFLTSSFVIPSGNPYLSLAPNCVYMCDYMYYESKQKGKLKNLVPAEEPELEQVEEQPMTVKA